MSLLFFLRFSELIIMYYVEYIKNLMRNYVVETDYTKSKGYSKEDILNFEINDYFSLYYL